MKSLNKHEQELSAKVVFDQVLAHAVHIQNFKSYMLLNKFTGEGEQVERVTSEALTNIDIQHQKMEIFIQQMGELSRIFMDGGEGYALTPDINAWITLPEEAIAQLFQEQNPYDPLREMIRLRACLADFEVKKEENITLFLSKKGEDVKEAKELYHFLFEGEDVTVTQFDCHLVVDPDTYFVKEQEVGIIMKNKTGKDAIIGIKLIYSKYNELDDIRTPDALKF